MKTIKVFETGHGLIREITYQVAPSALLNLFDGDHGAYFETDLR